MNEYPFQLNIKQNPLSFTQVPKVKNHFYPHWKEVVCTEYSKFKYKSYLFFVTKFVIDRWIHFCCSEDDTKHHIQLWTSMAQVTWITCSSSLVSLVHFLGWKMYLKFRIINFSDIFMCIHYSLMIFVCLFVCWVLESSPVFFSHIILNFFASSVIIISRGMYFSLLLF